MTSAQDLVGESLRRLLRPLDDSLLPADGDELEEQAASLLTESWRRSLPSAGLSERQLNVFYRLKPLVPRPLQLALRRVLIRRQGLPEFPRWPFDGSIVELLERYAASLVTAAGGPVEFRWFWPRGHAAAAILTHDVESAAGLRLALDLADVEQERGFRSSFNVVADWYPLDHGILEELRGRGFEIGVHGILHDRSMFASRSGFETALPQVREAAEAFRAVGFRSPATHRVVAWLAELPLEYDCTIPHSDPFEPQPGGCCSIWPFFLGDVVELPYTLPQDHTVLTLLRHESVDLWLDQIDEIVRRHGLIQSVTHPDPGYLGDRDKRTRYVELLDALRSRQEVWHALPRDVARWWRARDAGLPTDWPSGLGRASLADGRVSLVESQSS